MEILRDTTVILSTDSADYTPFAIEEGSVIHREIGGDHYLRLKFTLAEPVHLQVGDHIEAAGGDWYLVEDAYPTYSKSTGGYTYDVQFESYECLWKNFLLKYIPDNSAKETSFVLTGAIQTHVNVVLTNLKYHGFQFGGNDFIADVSTYNVKSTTDSDGNETAEAVYALDEAECITYSSSSIYDALNAIADAFECEWWVEEECIYFGFCEKTAATTLGVEYAEGTMTLQATGGSVDFELGTNLGDVKRSESTGDYCTRLFAFGSDRNLTDYYRKELISGYTVASKGTWYNTAIVEFTLPAVEDGTAEVTADQLAAGALFVIKSGTAEDGVYKSYTATLSGYAIESVTRNSDGGYTVVLTVAAWELPDFASMTLGFMCECTIGSQTYTDYILAAEVVSEDGAVSVSSAGVNAFTLDGIALPESAFKSNSAINGETFYWLADGVYALTSGEEIEDADEYEISNIRISQVDTAYLTDSDVDITISGVASTRLRLPDADTGDTTIECKDGYIQLTGLAEEQHVEGTATFEDIYPRTQCTVSDLYTATASADDDGDGEDEEYDYYYVTSEDDFTQNFDEDWIIEGETLHIVFTSGSLNGMDFECGFDALSNGQYFHVVSNTDYGTRLPNETLHPEVGDTFVIYGWDADALEDTTLVADAEEELFEEALDYFRDCLVDPSTYECTFLPDVAYNGGDLLLYDIGQKVRLVHAGYFAEGYRDSRIMGYEIPLDIPYDNPTYIIGEEAEYSRLDELEKNIEATAVSGSTYISSGSGNSVSISNGDKTSTSSNVYSAKYVDENFLRKDGDTATGLTTFAAGLKVGDGTYGIDEEGNATLKSVDATTVDGDTVKAGTLDVTGKSTLEGDASVGGDLSVTGDTALAGDLQVTGDTKLKGDASVSGDLSVEGTSELTDVEVSGDITSSNYNAAAQKGFVLTKNADTGAYTLKISNLEVWGKATFNELEVRKVSAIGGSLVLSPAASKIIVVDTFMYSDLLEHEGGSLGDETDYQIGWKCFYLADDGTTATSNTWVKGDQARCQSFNQIDSAGTYSDVANKDYWRLVIAVSDENEAIVDSDGNELYDGELFGWVALSLEDCQDGDLTTLDETDDSYSESLYKASVPASGDAIVCLGHQTQFSYTTDEDGTTTTTADGYENRMHAIVHSAATDSGPVAIYYKNINDFTLEGCIVEYHCPGGSSYIYSTNFSILSGSGKKLPSYSYEGEWSSGTTVYYGYYYTYDGDLWLWEGDDEATPDDPSEDVDGWTRMTYTSSGKVIVIEQSHGGMIRANETEEITLSVWASNSIKQGTEYTDDYTFAIERDSGDESSDAVWNAAFAANYDGGPTFSLTFSDLRITSSNYTTTFNVTATSSDGSTATAAAVYEV